RSMARPASARLTSGTLQEVGAVPQNYAIYAAALDTSAIEAGPQRSAGDLILLRPEMASVAPVHPEEETEVQTIRGYELRAGGRTYHIYRGDMHRHTDISADGAGDCSVMDLLRYALG